MHPNPSSKSIGLFTLLGLVAAIELTADLRQAEAGGQVDCSKLKDIQAFCQSVEGKEASLKRVMKDAEKAYKAAGNPDIECKSCHKGSNGGELGSEAESLWPKYKPFVDTAIKNYKK